MPTAIPTRRTHAVALVALLAAALAAGCGGGAEPTGPPAAAAPSGTPSGAPAGQLSSPAATPTPAAPDPNTCFLGSFEVVSITSQQGVATSVGTIRAAGGGGSLVLDLRPAGTWRLSSDGSRPVTFEVGPYTVDARIDGTLDGSYRRAGTSFVFEPGDAQGTATLTTPVGSREYDMDEVGPALAPDGTATITCQPDGAEFRSESVTMTLKRRP
jgi:hypothetical protein